MSSVSSTKPFVMCLKEIMYRGDLSPISRILYSGLLHYDRGDGCWASREKISKLTGLSEYHIGRGMKELIEFGLVRERRRGQGKTNIINIINISFFPDEEDTQEVEDLETKDLGVSPIYSNKETSEGDLEDDTGQDLDDEGSVMTSDDIVSEKQSIGWTENETLCKEDETLIRGIIHRFYSGSGSYERPLCPDGVVVGSDTTQVVLYIPNPHWRDHIQKHYLPLIENVVGKEVVLVNRM